MRRPLMIRSFFAHFSFNICYDDSTTLYIQKSQVLSGFYTVINLQISTLYNKKELFAPSCDGREPPPVQFQPRRKRHRHDPRRPVPPVKHCRFTVMEALSVIFCLPDRLQKVQLFDALAFDMDSRKPVQIRYAAEAHSFTAFHIGISGFVENHAKLLFPRSPFSLAHSSHLSIPSFRVFPAVLYDELHHLFNRIGIRLYRLKK